MVMTLLVFNLKIKYSKNISYLTDNQGAKNEVIQQNDVYDPDILSTWSLKSSFLCRLVGQHFPITRSVMLLCFRLVCAEVLLHSEWPWLN